MHLKADYFLSLICLLCLSACRGTQEERPSPVPEITNVKLERKANLHRIEKIAIIYHEDVLDATDPYTYYKDGGLYTGPVAGKGMLEPSFPASTYWFRGKLTNGMKDSIWQFFDSKSKLIHEIDYRDTEEAEEAALDKNGLWKKYYMGKLSTVKIKEPDGTLVAMYWEKTPANDVYRKFSLAKNSGSNEHYISIFKNNHLDHYYDEEYGEYIVNDSGIIEFESRNQWIINYDPVDKRIYHVQHNGLPYFSVDSGRNKAEAVYYRVDERGHRASIKILNANLTSRMDTLLKKDAVIKAKYLQYYNDLGAPRAVK